MKSWLAATKKWLHRLLRGSAAEPNIRPEQAKECANALGGANNIANLR